MCKSLLKLLLMTTLMIAFIGQSLAYHVITTHEERANLALATDAFVSYENAKEQDALTANEASAEKDDDCCEVECCENDCFCPTNACASLVYLMSDLPLSALLFLNEPVLLLTIKDTHFFANSLYRPPIFTA